MTHPTLLSLFIGFVASWLAYRVYLARALQWKAKRQGCQPARRYKHMDPIFGLDDFLKVGRAFTKNQRLNQLQQRHDTYGSTYETLSFGSSCINSIVPDNVRTVWSKNATDWGIQPLRLPTMHPFCGTGFITTDGEEWKRSHDLLKPSFHRSNISDFTTLETHFQIILQQIPEDGSKFNLQPWIIKLYLDMNTHFLFGEPIGMLSGSAPAHADGFLDAFQAGFNGCGMRFALGPLSFLMPTSGWLKACRKVHDFADIYVDRALEYRQKQKGAGDHNTRTQRTLLYNMALQTDNRTVLRDQIIQGMMASTDTTASLISMVVWNLARHADILSQLRAEIQSIGTRSLDFDRLGRMKLLQNVITETLRLYPVFPQNNRVALRDTILPTGGGSTGTYPIFAPAGTVFGTAFSTLHRDKQIWGADAELFRPSRWENGFQPPPFTFMPFGGGLRQCLAQQKATMETSYIVARLLQEFEDIKSEDDRMYKGQFALTAKNANGCWISVTPTSSAEAGLP
ncbi:cytochrome P450 [Lophiostoma macrostomum CBS 122681]|uniref:Cytochrome P450 n=1 Tax=Lophiostoma macrostomum CBS 122681 TaxID=1314788 RepID=A0A6A6SP83_9PLEO|nr:cytochrome P450 [Lophiostoma macrostomum CBS 122681]